VRVVSVNASLGRTVNWQGRVIETGIFKKPVEGRIFVGKLNLDGDRQSDLNVHGGKYKAVYAYALEHYNWWRRKLRQDLPFGAFGENLTIEGFPEEEVCVGDSIRVGEALLQAVQPRLPCFKLGIRFNDAKMVKHFFESGRWGVYFRVLETGFVASGDFVSWVDRDPLRFPIPELVRLHLSRNKDPAKLKIALKLNALPPEWRENLLEKVTEREKGE